MAANYTVIRYFEGEEWLQAIDKITSRLNGMCSDVAWRRHQPSIVGRKVCVRACVCEGDLTPSTRRTLLTPLYGVRPHLRSTSDRNLYIPSTFTLS